MTVRTFLKKLEKSLNNSRLQARDYIVFVNGKLSMIVHDKQLAHDMDKVAGVAIYHGEKVGHTFTSHNGMRWLCQR